MKKKKPHKKSLLRKVKNGIAKDLRTPKYKMKVKPNKRRKDKYDEY